MFINWTKCLDRMPPNDGAPIIAKYRNSEPSKMTGEGLNVALSEVVNFTMWVPYSDEAWRELNR